MLASRGARCAPVLVMAAFLGGCGGPTTFCPASVAQSFEVLDDGAAVMLLRTPEEAMALARDVCGDRSDVLIRLEWSDEIRTTVRFITPGRPELGLELVKRVAREAERR